MGPLRIAIVGFGKIARDRHVPAIAETEGVTLAAIASPNESLPGVPHATTLEELLRDGPPIDAVALCTPPQVRREQAAVALAAGKHVLLEKPPGVAVGEVGPCWRPRPRPDALCSPPGIRASLRLSSRRANGSRAGRSPRSELPGRKTCGSGIRARPGSGSPAGSAYSIPASTRFRF